MFDCNQQRTPAIPALAPILSTVSLK